VISSKIFADEGLLAGSLMVIHFFKKVSFLLEAVKNATFFFKRFWLYNQLQEHHIKAEYVGFEAYFYLMAHHMSDLSTLLPSPYLENNHPLAFVLHKQARFSRSYIHQF
jgi:hypothetical protein